MNNGLHEKTKLRSMELKKHVAVIHSSGKISLLQRKLANALLFHAYDDLLTLDEHTIPITTLTKLIGYDSNDHKKIKQALMDLLATVIEWNIIDGEKIDKDGIWNASSIIADVSIQGSSCTYSYSNKMRNLLYHPSVYGRLNLEVQAQFQSTYGLALYENCNRYQDIGQTPVFALDKFRKLMGVEEDKYKIFRDFKTRVLDKAVQEVNKYSPLTIEPVLKKQNRQVVAVQFLIKRSKVVLPDTNFHEDSLKSKLKNQYGLSEKQIQFLSVQYEQKYILEKINLIETSSSYIAGKIKNLGKYLLTALEEDFQAVKTSTFKKIEVAKARDQQYLREQILVEFSNFPQELQDQLLEKFSQKISKTLYAKIFAREGLENVLVKDQWINFLVTNTRHCEAR